MSALFEAVDVTKTFGGLTALQRVTFEIDGGIASIIGPNGAGKTTLFNVFTGLYRPDGGTVTFRGRSLVGLRPDEITALSYRPQGGLLASGSRDGTIRFWRLGGK